MILTRDTVNALLKSKHGREFIDGVRSEILRLDLISQMDAKLTDPQAIAVETLARRRAVEILKDILDPFIEPRTEDSPQEDKEVY